MSEIVLRIRPRDLAGLCLVGTLFGGGFAAVSAFTGAPNNSNGLPIVLPYQGTLTESTAQGGPVTGQRAMQFRLFDADTGGALLYESVSRGVQVQDGKFSAVLGSNAWPGTPGNQLDAGDLASSALWLEVIMDDPQGGAPIAFPRQRVAPAPQAIHASSAVNAQSAQNAASATGGLRAELDTILERTPPTTGERIKLLGLFCGETASTTGKVTPAPPRYGLRAAKAQCEALPGCGAGAHMCSAHEMMISASVELVPTSTVTWIFGGLQSGQNYNCAGYTEETVGFTSPLKGTTFYKGNGAGAGPGSYFINESVCTDSHPIACCR